MIGKVTHQFQTNAIIQSDRLLCQLNVSQALMSAWSAQNPPVSRRGERAFERCLLLCLLHGHGLERLPGAIQRRSLRLFAPRWQHSERGLALRRLTALFEGRLTSSQVIELAEGAFG